MTVSFGRAEQTWTLEDDAPPQAHVTPVDRDGPPIFVEEDMLALPSQENVEATLLHGVDGSWRLERQDTTVPLVSGQVFEVAGQKWRLSTPGMVSDTSVVDASEAAKAIRLQQVGLEFRVSRDEEHIQIRVERGADTIDLGSRSHNYVLLLLARERLADAARGVPDPACGWLDQEQLLRDLRTRPEHLNIDIFRIRKQFGAAGILDAASIVERRSGAKQLRIGVAKLAIQGV
jgi:hypothetical protein